MSKRLSPDFSLALVIAIVGIAVGMATLAHAGAHALRAL